MSEVVDLSQMRKKDESPFGPVQAGIVTTVTKISDRVNALVDQAVREVVPLGTPVEFDASITLLPTEVGPQPAVAVLLLSPSPLVGQKLSGMGILPLAALSEQSVKTAVENVWQNMDKQRQQMLGLN